MKKVTIIITTLNRPKLLRTAINSSLMQTYPNIELIIVDGSSDKKTSELLDFYKDDIIVIKDTKKNGISAARNLGLKKMSGDYVSFLDDDDCFHPRKIERQIEVINKKQIDIVYCPVGYKVKNYLIYQPLSKKKNYWKRLTCPQRIIMTPLARKECYLACGSFDESLKYHEDRDMWYRMQKKFKFAFHNNPDYINYNQNISRLTSQIEKILESKIRIYEKYKNDFKDKKSYYSDLHYELACTYLTFRCYKQFFNYFKKSIQNNLKFIPDFILKNTKEPLTKRKIKIDDECKKVFS